MGFQQICCKDMEKERLKRSKFLPCGSNIRQIHILVGF